MHNIPIILTKAFTVKMTSNVKTINNLHEKRMYLPIFLLHIYITYIMILLLLYNFTCSHNNIISDLVMRSCYMHGLIKNLNRL